MFCHGVDAANRIHEQGRLALCAQPCTQPRPPGLSDDVDTDLTLPGTGVGDVLPGLGGLLPNPPSDIDEIMAGFPVLGDFLPPEWGFDVPLVIPPSGCGSAPMDCSAPVPSPPPCSAPIPSPPPCSAPIPPCSAPIPSPPPCSAPRPRRPPCPTPPLPCFTSRPPKGCCAPRPVPGVPIPDFPPATDVPVDTPMPPVVGTPGVPPGLDPPGLDPPLTGTPLPPATDTPLPPAVEDVLDGIEDDNEEEYEEEYEEIPVEEEEEVTPTPPPPPPPCDGGGGGGGGDGGADPFDSGGAFFDNLPIIPCDADEDLCLEKCKRVQEYMRQTGCGGIVQCKRRPKPKPVSGTPGGAPPTGSGKCYASAVARCG